ncbi:hypothetical protein [Streptomyces sp. NPDC002853]
MTVSVASLHSTQTGEPAFHHVRKPEHFLAVVGIAAALICHRRLTA